ncbi:MAG: hypothetical protein LBT59_01345 [Clostridiales bacterium]|jgi:hypothetical protein|nr:hypothetical protein [Clostridiales bacterium]
MENFKNAVAKQFEALKAMGQIYRTDVSKDLLWETYLASFPEGTNPMFRKRAEFDCSSCHSFVKAAGALVAINENLELVSIWDFPEDLGYYSVVSAELSKLVKSKPISNIFLHTERTVSRERDFEIIIGKEKIWNHLYIQIPDANYCASYEIGTRLSDTQALHDVFIRSCREITKESVEIALDLISQNSLYRGEESKPVLEAFLAAKLSFGQVPEDRQDNYAWSNALKIHPTVAKMRNTAIGTFLVNLSEGMGLEQAVKAFETIMSPTNYQRPVAPATKSMIESARDKIEELGLTSALERRCATLADISINDLLFADRSVKSMLSGNVFDALISSASDKLPKNLDKIEEISIDTFLANVVPNASSIEVFFESKLIPNLVTLVAPVNASAGNLFKWNNGFSWAYNGSVADSIKERVKQAGGVVDAAVCCRLAWHNTDDLDLHMIEADNFEIYYGNKGRISNCGGMLDVDMNVSGETTTPVENIFYSKPMSKFGAYKLFVNNYRYRSSQNPGFEVEIDILGKTSFFSYSKVVRNKESIPVANLIVDESGIRLEPVLPASTSSASRTAWGISTESFHKVNALMLSPNFWEGSGVGNKHYFFMLDGCLNDDAARGFFNEFLKEELTPHRKVFEAVGSNMLAPSIPGQLSGLGFSSTQRAQILCKVSGKFNRLLKVSF